MIRKLASGKYRQLLEADLRLALRGDARVAETSAFGEKYEVRGTLSGPAGRHAAVVTVWIILKGDDFARFVTAYPGEVS